MNYEKFLTLILQISRGKIFKKVLEIHLQMKPINDEYNLSKHFVVQNEIQLNAIIKIKDAN